MGLYGGTTPLSLALTALRAISIEGSSVGSLGELQELMNLVSSRDIPRITVHRNDLGQANQALAALRAGRIVGRAILQP